MPEEAQTRKRRKLVLPAIDSLPLSRHQKRVVSAAVRLVLRFPGEFRDCANEFWEKAKESPLPDYVLRDAVYAESDKPVAMRRDPLADSRLIVVLATLGLYRDLNGELEVLGEIGKWGWMAEGDFCAMFFDKEQGATYTPGRETALFEYDDDFIGERLKNMPQFIKNLDVAIRLVRNDLRKKGVIIKSQASEASSHVSRDGDGDGDGEQCNQCRFRCDGNIWEINFDGEHGRFTGLVGFRIIEKLLRSPGIQQSSASLMGRVICSTAKPDRMMDFQAIADANKYLSEIYPKELKAAQHLHPVAAAEEKERLEHEKAKIERFLSTAKQLGGRVRNLGTTSKESARRAAAKNINKVYEVIEKSEKMPKLLAHLRDSIITGTNCVYRPASSLKWEFS